MKIGLICAMEEEIEKIKKKFKNIQKVGKNKFEVYVGNWNNNEIYMVTCGIGKVNAAIMTQYMIDKFDLDYIINTGVAGAINEKLDVMDIVAANDLMYSDFDVTAFGYKLGEIPRLENSKFKTSETLLEIVRDEVDYVGRITSSDKFVSNMEEKKYIYEKFESYCTEMEGAAIAHTCEINNVPFIVIRAISDKADGSANVNYDEFIEGAIEKTEKIVEHIFNNLEG
ncbi:MAG: 5'-methylthioadenosine/adenosylhomocysteine nucleosidase [Clostridia bacterium]|nr:5'-methylthioadenosine/adenosylhomocysteine nucleosidase [Clostridia bacterium]